MKAFASLLLGLALSFFGPAARAAPPEPAGYRMDNYHPFQVPVTVNGQPALTTQQTADIWRDGSAVFVDVSSHPPRPEGLSPGTVWIDKPHPSIKGARWLPDVGRGALSVETDDYFKRALAALTDGDKSRALVIFCKRDCWMSWNAAKRAQSYGYARILWYSDGIEGWTEAGLPTEKVTPYP